MPILVRRRTLGFVDIDGTQKQKEMEETSKQEGNKVGASGSKGHIIWWGAGCKQGRGEKDNIRQG